MKSHFYETEVSDGDTVYRSQPPAPLPATSEHERGIIDALIKLQDDWDGHGAPAPNSQSAYLAKSAIDIASAEGLSFDRIAPAGEGGIGLCCIRGEKYADMECLNDGEIFSALSDGHGYRDVIQVQATASGLKKATRRIGEFLGT